MIVAAGFEAVAAEFERNLEQRGDRGAAFAAVVDGVPVVDLWGGVADPTTAHPWREDTLGPIFSGSKALVATCLLLLIERGKLDLEAPVASYWPGFAAEGKGGVLVRHLVSHRAGLPGLTTPATVTEATDPVRMANLVAAQPALCPPGACFYYHALTFGWLCGELIRRIDGRPVGRLLAEEIAAPLGLEAWIGLPAEEDERVALVAGEAGHDAADDSGEDDPVAWSIWRNPPRFEAGAMAANTRAWRGAEVPGSNGVASARSIARLFGCLACGGEIDGVRLLAEQTVRCGRQPLGEGLEPFLSKRMSFGVGFELQTSRLQLGPPPAAFGHTGAGGSVHGCWPGLTTGFSYITNTLRENSGTDPRSAALLRALHRGVAGR